MLLFTWVTTGGTHKYTGIWTSINCKSDVISCCEALLSPTQPARFQTWSNMRRTGRHLASPVGSRAFKAPKPHMAGHMPGWPRAYIKLQKDRLEGSSGGALPWKPHVGEWNKSDSNHAPNISGLQAMEMILKILLSSFHVHKVIIIKLFWWSPPEDSRGTDNSFFIYSVF